MRGNGVLLLRTLQFRPLSSRALRGVCRFRHSGRRALQLLRSALREIFEEAAYERYLARHGLGPSSASYAAFLRDWKEHRPPRPRCC